MTRPLTMASIEEYLKDFGLEPEFGTHSNIRGLSGGQKVGTDGAGRGCGFGAFSLHADVCKAEGQGLGERGADEKGSLDRSEARGSHFPLCFLLWLSGCCRFTRGSWMSA